MFVSMCEFLPDKGCLLSITFPILTNLKAFDKMSS
jgi:hypothetical protein